MRPDAAAQQRLLASLSTLVAVGLGLLLHWPSVDSGFRGDDYVHAAMVRGQFPAERSPLDLFDFASGERADNARLRDFGYLPWWSVPEVRLRMARPLASALIARDHQWFGAHARPMHLHSMAWFVLLLCAASLLLHTTLPPMAAAVGIVLYALQPAHTIPICWLANRSTLVATTLSLLCVTVYLRARSRRSRVDAWAATLFCTSALCAGEYALTALAYVAAHECVTRREPLPARARALLYVAAPITAYLGLRAFLGADAADSGYYLSPMHEPLSFSAAALSRIPVLVADLLFGFPSGYFSLSAPLRNFMLSLELFDPITWRRLPDWPTWHVVIGVLAVIGYALLARFSAHLHAASTRARGALFMFGVGGLFALVPSAGSLPGDRLLGAAALGMCAIAASALVHAHPFAAGLPRRTRIARVVLGCVLLAVFVGWSGVRTYRQVRFFSHESESLRIWALDADLPDGPNAANVRVYVIGTADFTTAANLPWLRLLHGRPLAKSYRRLSPAGAPLDLIRVGERSLEVRALTGNLRGGAVPSLYRSERQPILAGHTASLPGLAVRVLRVADDNPAWMRFDFDRPLDDPELLFLHSTSAGLRRVRMPALGQTLRLPKPTMRDLRELGRGGSERSAE